MRNTTTTVVIAAGAVLAGVIVTRTLAQRGGEDAQPSSSQVAPASMQEQESEGCPWDCEQVPNGDVGIVDFLTLLGQWGQVGVSCDFDGTGVGIVAFLSLLANWGPCP